MINQDANIFVESLYYFHSHYNILTILSFAILFLIGIISIVLIRKQKLNNKLKIGLLSATIIFGGIFLGGAPNVILSLQNIVLDFILLNFYHLLIIRVLFFIILILIFGRIFCGYLCPLGAAQELASMIKFKSTYDNKKNQVKTRHNIQWVFLGIYITFPIIWGLESTLFLNPINGFLIFWNSGNFLIVIAFFLLLTIIFLSTFIYRPFCRFACPFGIMARVTARFSPFKIRRTNECLNCGLCEKICPTLEGFKDSKKGECYLCYRCVDFCKSEMFIDSNTISQINRFLTIHSMNLGIELEKEKAFDKIIKSIIRILIPYKTKNSFYDFIESLKGNAGVSNKTLYDLILRLRMLFSDEIKNIDLGYYEAWINQNINKWKEKLNSYQKDKIFYGPSQKK